MAAQTCARSASSAVSVSIYIRTLLLLLQAPKRLSQLLLTSVILGDVLLRLKVAIGL